MLCALGTASAANANRLMVRKAGHVRATLLSRGGAAPPTGYHPALPVLSRSGRALSSAKREAAMRRRGRPVSAAPRAAAARAIVMGGLSQPGLRASEALLGAPPDTTGAIGPDYFVEIVNDAVAVFRRSDLGRVAGPVPNETFMRRPGLTFVSDPQMQWDPQSSRWLYLAAAFTVNFKTLLPYGPNYLLFGFSKSGDPSDLSQGWCSYSLPSGSAPNGDPLLDDYPKLGHDDSHLIFGSNAFALGAGGQQNFISARVWAVPKPAAGTLSSCPAAPVATIFGSADSPLLTSSGAPAATPVPANTTDASALGYVVAAEDATLGTQDQIMTWHVGGSAVSPSLVADADIPVASYSVPRSARQFGFPRIDTLDARLTMAVARADPSAGGQEAIWTQHTIDPGNGSVAMRWYELLPGSGQARQQGTIAGLGVDVFNGAISPGMDGGSAVAVYNRSGPLLLPEIRVQARGPAFPAGLMGPSLWLASSAAPDFDLSCAPVCRWGDYSGASPDPRASTVVWVANQTIAKPGGLLPNWTTTIAAIDAAG
jgi:hypothetical protein